MKLMHVINQEELTQLKEEGNIEFMSYGNDKAYFAIVGRDLYNRHKDTYVLLKENFRDNPTHSSQ